MEQSTARVAYADPQGVFQEIEIKLRSHVSQLKNLHWNPGDGRPLRTIPRLDIHLVAQETDRKPQHQILGVSDAPIAQLLVLHADSSDEYRHKVRKPAQAWMKQCETARDPTGWLVVHYVGQRQPRSKGVWSKMLGDLGGPEHCTQLYLDDSELEGEMWSGVISLLKNQILYAFGARVALYEAEIRKLQSTRDVMGWNFGMLFAMQESLAWTFEKLNFLKEAADIYEELERMAEPDFFTSPASSATNLPATRMRELPGLLASSRDEITTAMLGKTASEFEYHRHVLSRETALRIFMAIGQRAESPSIADNLVVQSIRHVKTYLPRLMRLLEPNFVPLFQLRVSRELGQLVVNYASEKTKSTKAELLLLQRDALQALGKSKGFVIPGVFNDISLLIDPPEVMVEDEPALESADTLREEFSRLTLEAIELFRSAGALRSVNRLVTQLALTEFHGDNREACWKLLQSTDCLDPSSEQPPPVDLLLVAIDCARHMGLDQDVLHLAWTLLGMAPTTRTLSYKGAQTAVDEITRLADFEVQELPLEPFCTVELEPYIVPGPKGSYCLEARVRRKAPHLPFPNFSKAEIVCVVDSDVIPHNQRRQIIFTCLGDDCDLMAQEKMVFSTNHFIQGLLRVTQLRLAVKKQILIHSYPDVEPQADLGGDADTQADEDEDSVLFIGMQPLESCIHAELGMSSECTTTKRILEVRISSPRVLEWACVQIRAMDYSLELLMDQLDTSQLHDFTSGVATVPALLNADQPMAQAHVVIEYPGGGYYEFTQTVDLSLLVLVQVQEFFRPDRIFSNFMVEPMTDSPVAALRAELRGSPWFEVLEPTGYGKSEPQIVFEHCPVSYVFPLRHVKQKTPPSSLVKPGEMQLKLYHRLMIWECYALLETEIWQRLEKQGLLDYMIVVRRMLRLLSIDVMSYSTQGRIIVSTTGLERIVAAQFRYLNPQHAEKVADILSEVFELSIKRPDDIDTKFSDLNVVLDIPVPDPEVRFVHYVSLELSKDSLKEANIVGVPIAADLSIRTVEVQPHLHNDEASPTFMYEMDRSSDGWSYGGRTRGSFTAESGLHESVMLVPTRAGQVLLPAITVVPSRPVASELVATYAATKIMVMPEVNTVAVSF